MFASELLNNNVPVHVIGALLGHAGLDTVMVYAKLYPATLIDEYRKTVRQTYSDFHGPDSLRAPTAEEWREFSAACNLRDLGTHRARCRPAITAVAGWCASGAATRSPSAGPPRSSGACSPVTSGRWRARGRAGRSDRRARAGDPADLGRLTPRRRAQRRRRRRARGGRVKAGGYHSSRNGRSPAATASTRSRSLPASASKPIAESIMTSAR
jgi:hypothetical protein